MSACSNYKIILCSNGITFILRTETTQNIVDGTFWFWKEQTENEKVLHNQRQ